LFPLPGELRNKIYDLAFKDSLLIRHPRSVNDIYVYDYYRYPFYRKSYDYSIWSLARSCRRLYAEIAPVIYQSGTFCCDANTYNWERCKDRGEIWGL
jgi:hypothetical protein